MAEPTLTGGQYADCSIQEFRRRLTLAFRDNEEVSLPDTALRSVLLDADRIAWELAHARDAIRNAALEEAAALLWNDQELRGLLTTGDCKAVTALVLRTVEARIRAMKTTPPESKEPM